MQLEPCSKSALTISEKVLLDSAMKKTLEAFGGDIVVSEAGMVIVNHSIVFSLSLNFSSMPVKTHELLLSSIVNCLELL